MKNDFKVSLIVSTYNSPRFLELCLKSICNQKRLPDEVLIGDDGSTSETKAVIDKFKEIFPVPLLHIWQADEGFQLAKIRNKCIARAKYDYIIQIDGDIVLHPYFVQDHILKACPGYFVVGSRAKLNPDRSGILINSGTNKVHFWQTGVRRKMNAMRCLFLSSLFHHYKRRDLFYGRGCNVAVWKKDLISINGYNEDYRGWGLEDSDIFCRLYNSGARRRFIKFAGIQYHLYHRECDNKGKENNELLAKAIREKIIYCQKGVQQYLTEAKNLPNPN